jgi:PilZ domain
MKTAGVSSPENIFALVKSLASRSETLTMTLSYKGLVLSEPVKVVEVDNEYIVLQAQNSRACSVLKKSIHLHSHVFPYPVSAVVVDINQWTGRIKLEQLAFTGSDWKNRNGDRVQPKNPTYVTILNREIRITGLLEDISKTGVGVMAYRLLDRGPGISLGDAIRIDFRLPDQNILFTLKGTVASMSKVGRSLVRIGIRITTRPVQSLHLEEFINFRRSEILTELETANQQATERFRVEALYF